MTRLHQLIAVTKTVRGSSEATFTKIYQSLAKDATFLGLIKTYQPQDEDGRGLPPESVKVLAKAPDLISQAQAALERLINHAASMDRTNTLARADIEIGGVILASKVPVSTLLYLEKKLTDVHTFVSKLPVLDPMESWTWDPSTQVWRSDPYKTLRSRKVEEFVTIAPATDKHPAQVAKVAKDEVEGTWTTTKLSGAIPSSARQGLLSRVEELTIAVKRAREQANTQEVMEVAMGNALMNHIFAGLH